MTCSTLRSSPVYYNLVVSRKELMKIIEIVGGNELNNDEGEKIKRSKLLGKRTEANPRVE